MGFTHFSRLGEKKMNCVLEWRFFIAAKKNTSRQFALIFCVFMSRLEPNTIFDEFKNTRHRSGFLMIAPMMLCNSPLAKKENTSWHVLEHGRKKYKRKIIISHSRRPQPHRRYAYIPARCSYHESNLPFSTDLRPDRRVFVVDGRNIYM